MGTTEYLDFNKLTKLHYARASMGTGTVDLRLPPGGDGTMNANSYPMPADGRVMAFSLHYFAGTIATNVNDTWRIRKFTPVGTETTLDTVVARSGMVNPTGTNYTITVRLATPFDVLEGDILLIKRQVNGGSLIHVNGYLWVDFESSTRST